MHSFGVCFKEFSYNEMETYNGDYGGSKLDPEMLKILCEETWPKLVPQWPFQGKFDPNIVALVYRRVSNDPKQYPYIVSWEALVKKKPKWIIKHQPKPVTIMAVTIPKKGADPKKRQKKSTARCHASR